MLRPAIFLDRDDTINRNADLPDAAWGDGAPGDLLNPAFALLLPGVEPALRRLRDAGYAIILITNQGGVARGGGTTADIEAVDDALRQLLPLDPENPTPVPFAASLIDACYACPFHPGGTVARFADEHRWRKPGPGMIESAAAELGLDLSRSWMVGDKQRDLDAAIAAGIDPDLCVQVGPNAPVAGLPEAVDIILGQTTGADRAVEMQMVPTACVTLRAHDPGGSALSDQQTRETVLAAARGLAERIGVELVDIRFIDGGLRTHLACSRIAATGFAAELRRITNDWHQRHRTGPLWVDRTE